MREVADKAEISSQTLATRKNGRGGKGAAIFVVTSSPPERTETEAMGFQVFLLWDS